MLKKLCTTFLLIIVLSVSCMQSFASGSDIIYDKNTPQTEQFLVTITRPEGDESTFKKSYVICGISDKEDIKIELLIRNEYTGVYEEFLNTDNESSWEMGDCGIFIKEVVLPKNGLNRIRIAAYRSSESDKLELGKNLQVNDFTITVLNQGVKYMIQNGLFRVSDMLNNMFSNK